LSFEEYPYEREGAVSPIQGSCPRPGPRSRFPTGARIAVSLVLLSSLASCAGFPRGADLAALYREASRYHGAERNPVVLVPGILGSRIEDAAGRLVWGAFSGEFADPATDDGARAIALPMREGAPLSELHHDHRAPGALDRVRLRFLGLPVLLQAYAQLLGALGVGGYRDEELGRSGAIDYGDDHYTCFQFAYDWRRDLVESARALDAFLESRAAYVEEEFRVRGVRREGPIRFDVVAHSMGGLVLRYYLRYGTADLPTDGALPELTWAGARRIDRAILIGTPNAGSLDALRILLEGYSPGPLQPFYDRAIVGTMPSLYQILPRVRHGGIRTPDGDSLPTLLDLEVWEQGGWGLLSSEADRTLRRLLPEIESPADRRRVAADQVRKCLDRARAFQAALDRPAPRPPGLELILFAGDAISTPRAAEVGRPGDPYRVVEWGPGDEVVLRSSAVLDERAGESYRPSLQSPIDWSQVMFLCSEHLEMTRDPTFIDNLLYLLLEAPRAPRSGGRDPES